jgi:carbonic anhydrase
MRYYLWALALIPCAALADPLPCPCTHGLNQSPIDIDVVWEAQLPPLQFHYGPADMHVFRGALPGPLAATPAQPLVLEIDTTRYSLTDIHFHTPAEHTVVGQRLLMEIHFVHTSVEGNLVIVAQWTTPGMHNPAFETILQYYTLSANEPKPPGLQFKLDPRQLLAPFHGYYTYEGSETFPPCRENVTWYLMKDTIEVGELQMEKMYQLQGNNSRPVQPYEGRRIYTSP